MIHLDGLTIDPVTGRVTGVRRKRRGRKRRITAADIKRAWQTALREITDATAKQIGGADERNR